MAVEYNLHDEQSIEMPDNQPDQVDEEQDSFDGEDVQQDEEEDQQEEDEEDEVLLSSEKHFNVNLDTLTADEAF